MAELSKVDQAQQVFDKMCAVLDAREWKYESFPEDLTIRFHSIGDDLPMEFIVIVDSERQLLRVMSPVPVDDNKNKRLDLAIATCVASYGLSYGSFDYDITTGHIFFRLTVCFRNSTIGDGLFTYLVGVSSAVVDKYNDKFFAISKGLLSVDDFIVSEQ